MAWARATLADDLDPLVFFREVFTPAMQDIGDQFGRLDIFLPELMASADAAKAVDEQVLRSLIGRRTTTGKARAAPC